MALGRRMCLTERADGAPPAGCRVRDEAPSRRLRRQVSRSACRAAWQELEEGDHIAAPASPKACCRAQGHASARPRLARPRLPRRASPARPTRAVGRAALPPPDLPELEAQARYHRDRLALYRARVLSAKPASAARLRELQRASAAADARLRHAATASKER